MKNMFKQLGTATLITAMLLLMINTVFADVNITRSSTKVYKNIGSDMTISDTQYYSNNNDNNIEHKVVFVVGADKVNIDGVYSSVDEPPYLSNGRTMLPLRAVTETLKAFKNNVNISWNSVNKEVMIFIDDNKIVFKVGSDYYTFNGENRKMTGMPEIKKGRVFIPVRDIANAMDIDINWNALSKEVILTN